jgi:uncharacterized protein (DUF924 family)
MATPSEAEAIVAFWRSAGPDMWFAKDADFDRRFRDRFLRSHEAAARGEFDWWIETAAGALGLLLLLDQFPRNAFRGTPRMYQTDPQARYFAAVAVDAAHDLETDEQLRLFFYLPFAHSESLADQERSVALTRHLGEFNRKRSERHREIIRRFGRFPHRNAILGRPMRPGEQRYLDEGGFAG